MLKPIVAGRAFFVTAKAVAAAAVRCSCQVVHDEAMAEFRRQCPKSQRRWHQTKFDYLSLLSHYQLHYWTINVPAQMQQLVNAGADGLLTDYVARGQSVRRRGLRGPMPSRP